MRATGVHDRRVSTPEAGRHPMLDLGTDHRDRADVRTSRPTRPSQTIAAFLETFHWTPRDRWATVGFHADCGRSRPPALSLRRYWATGGPERGRPR